MAVSTIGHGSESTAPAAPADKLEIEVSKGDASSAIVEGDVEVQAVDGPDKTYYSKLSVWLMVLFSGLAIGSDG